MLRRCASKIPDMKDESELINIVEERRRRGFITSSNNGNQYCVVLA